MTDSPLWTPAPDARAASRFGAFLRMLEEQRGLHLAGHEDAWRWSVDHLDGFWSAVWEFFDVQASRPPDRVLSSATMPGARWFTGALLNYAENALAHAPAADEIAVIAHSQTRQSSTLTGTQLRDLVARAAAGLLRLGVGPGDRVAGFVPNIPEALVAFLASASIGAVWTSCAPEFGVRSVVDRLQQVGPTVLVVVDGYRWGSREVDRTAEVREIIEALPSLRAVVHVPYGNPDGRVPAGMLSWNDLVATPGAGTFVPLAPDHPLYILYSSGTTGLPKPIVHGHAGILLEHCKALGLHCDLGPGDRFLWYSTTGWMMWNLLVSGLCVGATVVLVDGDPGHPDLGWLWRLTEESGVTHLGVSAPFLMACRRAGVRPRETVDLSRLRLLGSTGSPLPAEGFHWVYDAVSDDVHLSSLSGGTDVCTAFVGGSPLVPVRAGQISCRWLGARVEAYDDEGKSVVGVQGELVLTAPLPSMPIGLWGDDDGSRLRAAYFDGWPGVWRHGDWITIEPDGSCVISGRSDATLNRGGIRVGTAELYAVVEDLVEVADSLVVHLDAAERDRLVLFIAPAPGYAVDDRLRDRLRAAIRRDLSPRHAPDVIVQVPAIPRTISGKKLEVPVKRILQGVPVDTAAARGSLADPRALDIFAELAGTL